MKDTNYSIFAIDLRNTSDAIINIVRKKTLIRMNQRAARQKQISDVYTSLSSVLITDYCVLAGTEC